MFVPLALAGPSAHRSPEFTFHGRHDSWVAAIPVRRDAVAAMLPCLHPFEFGLTRYRDLPDLIRPADPALYPLLLFAGRQRNVKPEKEILLERLVFPLNYHETIAVAPFVTFGGRPGAVFNCVTGIFLDNAAAMIIGDLAGLNKEETHTMSMIEHLGCGSFSAAPERNASELAIDLQAPDRTPAAAGPTPGVADLLIEIFRTPALGDFARVRDDSSIGELLPVAICDMRWDLDRAMIQPRAITCELGEAFCPAGAGKQTIEPIGETAFGGFWMDNCRWTIPFPDYVRA